MKKYYIEPELEVVVCRVNGMLMGSLLDPVSDDPIVTPDPDPFDGEFSGHELEDDFQFDDEF